MAKVTFKSSHLYIFDVLVIELPVNWLKKHGLLTKRIYALVCNSEPNPFNPRGGFARGAHEGERVMVESAEGKDAIKVHVRNRVMTIPARFLFPQMPTIKGQVVVVVSSERAGEVFTTHALNENGLFPLVTRGHGSSKGTPKLFVEPNRLAQCDAMSNSACFPSQIKLR